MRIKKQNSKSCEQKLNTLSSLVIWTLSQGGELGGVVSIAIVLFK